MVKLRQSNSRDYKNLKVHKPKLITETLLMTKWKGQIIWGKANYVTLFPWQVSYKKT